MSLIGIILLAIALGVDCLVVSFSQGLIYEKNRIKNSLLLAFTMGFFQGFMPFIGYFGASGIISYIKPFSKWIIFGIFLFLGLKFIKEAFEEKEEEKPNISFKCLVSMGIATSIDALASGISIKLSDTSLLLSVVLIGIMSFLLSITGFSLAVFFKKLPSKILEIFGGLILIALAVKALV